MTYQITKVYADWQTSKELEENPIINEEDQVVELEAEDITDRLADSIIAKLNQQPIAQL